MRIAKPVAKEEMVAMGNHTVAASLSPIHPHNKKVEKEEGKVEECDCNKSKKEKGGDLFLLCCCHRHPN